MTTPTSAERAAFEAVMAKERPMQAQMIANGTASIDLKAEWLVLFTGWCMGRAAMQTAEPVAYQVQSCYGGDWYDVQQDQWERAKPEHRRIGDAVTMAQAVLLAGIQSLCISACQEYNRQCCTISQFDKGWFMGQLLTFDLYTSVEKSAIQEARSYIENLAALDRAPSIDSAADANAARYMFLRDPDNVCGPNWLASKSPEELDAAIDAALQPEVE